ncbi:uncharacterized protein [Petaurus breviceps papuanus]|uniref:uncharacterized protein n=1 Tax=Petaurus breviceps papuanus TaxID=3040969 RepID=UPI0036DB6864
MGPRYGRTSWRPRLLQYLTVLTGCILIQAWTPGSRMHPGGSLIRMWWRNATIPRQQDGYTCPAKETCNIANWTANANATFYKVGAPIFAILKGDYPVNLTMTTLISVNCCITTLDFTTPESRFPIMRGQLEQTCNTWNIHNSSRILELNVTGHYHHQYLFCINATIMQNRTSWVQYLLLLPTHSPTSHSPGIIRVPKSCTNASISQHKIVFHYNVTFPPLANCVRRKRAWYDTLLGGAGTGLGIVNSVDLESLASRLRSAGQDVSQALTVNAKWLPTTILPHQRTLKYQGQFLQVFNDSTLASFVFDTNITRLFNWTRCSLQNLYTLIQKENAQRLLQNGDTQLWNRVFDLSSFGLSKAWRKQQPDNARCTALWCTGTIVYYQVKTWTIMCQFHVIPFVLHKYFALPHIYGNYIDWYNVTHTLSDCVVTSGGMVCGMMTRQMEPCLLPHSSNLCDLTLYPLNNFTMLYEVSSQYVCISSNNETDLASVSQLPPFSGCLTNVSFLHWQNEDYYFSPDRDVTVNLSWVPKPLPLPHVSLSLEPLIYVLNQSHDLKRLLEFNQRALNEHRIQTHIVAGQLTEASHLVISDTNHHWYDFLFRSSSSVRYFNGIAIPILLLSLFLCSLCLCNCFMYTRMRKIYTQFTPLAQFSYYSHDLKAK